MKNKLIGENVFIILSAPSGSGKTTFAEWLDFMFEANHKFEICCADDYHMKDGEYKFDVNKLGAAHKWCFEKAQSAFSDGVQTVVLANTNLEPKEYKHYIEEAEKFDYKIVHLALFDHHGSGNIHNVPEQTLERQHGKFKNLIENY